MPKGKPTPDYKFRLLCKRCNSYLHTLCVWHEHGLQLLCHQCDQQANYLDEEKTHEQARENHDQRPTQQET